ncbi:MAG: bacteriohemerythrin [Candidatus Zixiibacteriota bacterium]
MQTVEWTEQLAIGVETIDRQHKRWIGLLNNLIMARLANRAQDVLADALSELYIYTVTHFDEEERIFAQIEYSGKKTHREMHASFITKFGEFKNKFENNEAGLSDEMIEYLSDWLVWHISTVDPELAHLKIHA